MYQNLPYPAVLESRIFTFPTCGVFPVRGPGLEPGTSSLSATRSNQLSYTRKFYNARLGIPKFGAEIVTQGSALSTLILNKRKSFPVERPESIGRISPQLEPKRATRIHRNLALGRFPQSLRFRKRFFLFGNDLGF